MTRSKKANDFSRIKKVESAEDHSTGGPRDHEGRRALFTAESMAPEVAAHTGSVVIACGSCGEESVLSPMAALRHAVPSLHLPFIKRDHGSWMRCPACQKHTWVSVQIRLP